VPQVVGDNESSETTSPPDQPGARAVEAGAPWVLPQDGHRV